VPEFDPRARKLIGYCSQFDGTYFCFLIQVLWPNLTPSEHIRLYGGIKELVGQQLEDEVSRLISAVGLEEFKDTHTTELSGGNKRKTSIAIAAVGSPNLLFLDEPTTGMSAWSLNSRN
jgi:ABC-type multidrug transport system ATPase subunit